LSETELTAMLAAENRVIATACQSKLTMKRDALISKLAPDRASSYLLDFINERGVLDAFTDDEMTRILVVLRDHRVTGWALTKARGLAALAALHVQKKPPPPPQTPAPRPPPLPEVAADPTSALNGAARRVVNKNKRQHAAQMTANQQQRRGVINIIGNIPIPKDIYNLLRLGAEFTCESWQAPPCLEQETIKNYFSLPHKQLMTCYELGMTIEIYNEINNLFAFIANTNKQLSVSQLWAQFWYEDNKHTAIRLVDNIFAKTKYINCYKRLMHFMSARRLIAKMADKNAGLTIMRIEYYVTAVTTHIKSNPLTYKTVEAPANNIATQLENICTQYKINKDLWLPSNTTVREPVFYIMPKIHKTPIGFRPIIPSHSWYTTTTAKRLHQKLWPIVNSFPWVITDRLKLINELEQRVFKQTEARRTIVATIDVTALYTSICIGDGIGRIRTLLRQYGWKQSDIDCCCSLLEWVLTNNYFKIGDQWYQQIQGAAMGGNVSGTFADLVLATLEQSLIPQIAANKILLYRRYRDDILVVASSIEAVHKLTAILNEVHYLKFNIEQIGQSVNFLDLTIGIDNPFVLKRKLSIYPYRKPVASQMVTHFATYKPDITKASWITGENIRLLRSSQSQRAYNTGIEVLKNRLRKAGYPKSVIRSKIRYKFQDRNWLLSKTDKMENKWYPMQNVQRAHDTWNMIQNNLQPLLDFHNIHTTAARGRTTMDILNSVAKRNVLSYLTPQKTIVRKRNKAAQRNARRLDARNQDREDTEPASPVQNEPAPNISEELNDDIPHSEASGDTATCESEMKLNALLALLDSPAAAPMRPCGPEDSDTQGQHVHRPDEQNAKPGGTGMSNEDRFLQLMQELVRERDNRNPLKGYLL